MGGIRDEEAQVVGQSEIDGHLSVSCLHDRGTYGDGKSVRGRRSSSCSPEFTYIRSLSKLPQLRGLFIYSREPLDRRIQL